MIDRNGWGGAGQPEHLRVLVVVKFVSDKVGKRQLDVLTAIPVGIAICAMHREPDRFLLRLPMVALIVARVGRRERQTVGKEKVGQRLRNTN